MDTSHFIITAKDLRQEALHYIEEQLRSIQTDGTPVSEGQRLMELADIHLQMHCVAQAEREYLEAITLLLEYSNDLRRKGIAIPDYIPRILFAQEHRAEQITILQACIRGTNALSGICECANRKRDAKRYDKESLRWQEYLRKEIEKLSGPQLIPMKVVGADFVSVQVSPI